MDALDYKKTEGGPITVGELRAMLDALSDEMPVATAFRGAMYLRRYGFSHRAGVVFIKEPDHRQPGELSPEEKKNVYNSTFKRTNELIGREWDNNFDVPVFLICDR